MLIKREKGLTFKAGGEEWVWSGARLKIDWWLSNHLKPIYTYSTKVEKGWTTSSTACVGRWTTSSKRAKAFSHFGNVYFSNRDTWTTSSTARVGRWTTSSKRTKTLFQFAKTVAKKIFGFYLNDVVVPAGVGRWTTAINAKMIPALRVNITACKIWICSVV